MGHHLDDTLAENVVQRVVVVGGHVASRWSRQYGMDQQVNHLADRIFSKPIEMSIQQLELVCVGGTSSSLLNRALHFDIPSNH